MMTATLVRTATRLYAQVEDGALALVLHPSVRRILDALVVVVLPLMLMAAYLFLPESLFGVPVRWESARLAGKVAYALLLILLFMQPIGALFHIRALRRTLPYRQHGGIAMAYIALYHALIQLQPALFLTPAAWSWRNGVLYGGAALAITLLLAATSNRRSQRLLRRWWKRLHRSVYLVIVLVVLHRIFLQGEWGDLLLLALYAVLRVAAARGVRYRLPIISRP